MEHLGFSPSFSSPRGGGSILKVMGCHSPRGKNASFIHHVIASIQMVAVEAARRGAVRGGASDDLPGRPRTEDPPTGLLAGGFDLLIH